MAKTKSLEKRHRTFIEDQKMFFVATTPDSGRINLSPKGMDSFRIVDETTVLWMNLTGSGNETQAHVAENGRMTIMFCAFEGAPNILRLYGEASFILPGDNRWDDCISKFPKMLGTRQFFELKIDLIQTSCGFAVPLYEYEGQRDTLTKWSEHKGEQGIRDYWDKKNKISLDDKPIKF
ncbi:MAG: pyridoxamine 5'-phosphate oxidase [Crocinitomicaceae bacterium]|nr:pyridoxamine 5'-phosphate oxidase [Crocinitomicaceae bacterium]|tara:strand:- start:17640 stop:18173 length:534 start_codon:yes stop_codon:yes gene_type:complete